MDAPEGRPEIDYPCRWSYRLIGEDEAAVRAAVGGILRGAAHTLSVARSSRRGRYVSLHLELVVDDEDHRLRLYAALHEHAAIRMVL